MDACWMHVGCSGGHVTGCPCVQAEVSRDSSPMVQRSSSLATSHEVWKYICELGISKVRLQAPPLPEGGAAGPAPP